MTSHVHTIRIDVPRSSRLDPDKVLHRFFFVEADTAGTGAWGPWWKAFFEILLSFRPRALGGSDRDTENRIEKIVLDPEQVQQLITVLKSAPPEELGRNANLAHAVETIPATSLPIRVLYFGLETDGTNRG